MSRSPIDEPTPENETDEEVVHGDEVHIDEWAAPDVCDDRGFLRAGKILEWMDVVGALAASRYARLPAVTVAVDGCDLRAPVLVGSRVTMRAKVVYTSRRAVGVGVTMEAAAANQRSWQTVLGGYMTFVAIGPDRRPARVPAFTPTTPEAIARNREGHIRRQFHDELGNREVLADPLALVPSADDLPRDPLRHLLRELGGRLAGRRTPVASRSPHPSYVHRIEPVRGGKLNFHGTLYGGTLMRWLESGGAMSATAFLETPVRLVAVHGLQFQRPVPNGVFCHIHAAVAHTGDDDVTVRIVVRSEDPLTARSTDNLTGFLTYVPLERKVAIPPVARHDAVEAALYCEVALRKALQARIEALHASTKRSA